MKESRKCAACTVFEGKIVVSGGVDFNSVESYDYYENKWDYFPSMILNRCYHATVSTGNNLFVIGGWHMSRLSCEVFNSFTRKFTLIKTFCYSNFEPECVSFCNGFAVFDVSDSSNYNKNYNYNPNKKANIYLYDAANNTFVAAETSHCESFCTASCVKYFVK